MMEAVRTAETSAHFNVTTRRYIPEDCKLHTRRRENLKSDKTYSNYLSGKSGDLFTKTQTQVESSNTNRPLHRVIRSPTCFSYAHDSTKRYSKNLLRLFHKPSED
jgi:hypothetical protein